MPNMWAFLLLFSAVGSSLASKEYAPLKDLPDDEKNVLLELVKRLENDGGLNQHRTGSGRNAGDRCENMRNKTTIIKKNDSEKNGALFLKSFQNVETNGACSELCCKNKSCDLAVYENKDKHNCYLFRCQGKCKFGYHSSYISNTIVSRRALSPTDISELDLLELDEGSDLAQSGKAGGASSTTTPVPSSTSTTHMYIRAHSVSLQGAYCEQNFHCEDPSAVCSFNQCRCGEGFYNKNHVCRKICPPSNFECLHLGTIGKGPQCVPRERVCDKVMHCPDGSDEYNCPDADGQFKEKGVHSSQTKPKPSSDAVIHKETDKSSAIPKNEKAAQPAKSAEIPSQSHDDQHTPNPPAQQPAPHPPTQLPASKQQPQTDSQRKQEIGTQEKQTGSHEGSASQQETSNHKVPAVKPSPPSIQSAEPAKVVVVDEVEELVRSQNSFIARQKLEPSPEVSSMQGPIIALALGLAFTLVLLVVVACRLRTVRRRLRKGRPLHSNEADYLINAFRLT